MAGKRDTASALLDRHGRTYADELGIDLAKGAPSPLFRLLCASMLMSAVWESASALGAAFGCPEFRERAVRYPDSAVAAPHVFKKVAVPGIRVA